MTGELGSKEDYSFLIERIKQAFADVPYPGDDNIISTPDHVAVCDECSDLHKALVGRRWMALIDDEDSIGHVGHAMSFFSSAGWQYYLPAYLIQHIKLHKFSSLYFRPNTNPKLDEYCAARINRLTEDQCQAVIAYLLIVLKEASYSQYMYERNKEAVDHWRENYQRIVVQSSGAG